jgi:hypothetical protein
LEALYNHAAPFTVLEINDADTNINALQASYGECQSIVLGYETTIDNILSAFY